MTHIFKNLKNILKILKNFKKQRISSEIKDNFHKY